MLRIIQQKWAAKKDALAKKLESVVEDIADYSELVEISFGVFFGDEVNTGNITVVDDGDYQGTLIFLIPFNTYQPSERDYLLTYVGYGSCSGCDTLQYILDINPAKDRVPDLLTLCKDILTNTIKPYNNGWRHNSAFDIVEDDLYD